jgi:hypothetical protein
LTIACLIKSLFSKDEKRWGNNKTELVQCSKERDGYKQRLMLNFEGSNLTFSPTLYQNLPLLVSTLHWLYQIVCTPWIHPAPECISQPDKWKLDSLFLCRSTNNFRKERKLIFPILEKKIPRIVDWTLFAVIHVVVSREKTEKDITWNHRRPLTLTALHLLPNSHSPSLQLC